MMRAVRNIAAIMVGAGAVVSAGAFVFFMLVADTDADAKTITPKPPSWMRIATPSPYGKPQRRHRKFSHRLPAEPAGWGATAEPTTSATVAIGPVPPLPMRNPKKFSASVSRQKATARDRSGKSIEPAKAKGAAQAPLEHELSAQVPSVQVALKSEQESANRKPNQLSPLTPLGTLDVAVTGVLGEDPNENNEKDSQNAMSQPLPANKTAGAQFCDNISNAAADARFAWQKRLLKETEEKVSKRITELNTKIDEYRKWLAKRNEFSRKAQGVVVNIYTQMKPDAAAQQLTILDEEMAAAVITKLSPRAASAVMNEMDPKHAARLTSIISGAMTGPNDAPPPMRGGGT
jgi:flagellar motility protein MotE (MotC chaperone)